MTEVDWRGQLDELSPQQRELHAPLLVLAELQAEQNTLLAQQNTLLTQQNMLLRRLSDQLAGRDGEPEGDKDSAKPTTTEEAGVKLREPDQPPPDGDEPTPAAPDPAPAMKTAAAKPAKKTTAGRRPARER